MIPHHTSALLISDIHLTPSMPLTAQRFFDFCEKDVSQVEAVFILGDLFEYWIGDAAAAHSPFTREVRRALASLSSKTKTYYMHGNRDFLIGPAFLKKTGIMPLADPSLVNLGGQQYLLSHGDALCTADAGYQVFRRWTRKRWIQKSFLRLPLSWRRGIANHLRSNSQAQYQHRASTSHHRNVIKTNVTQDACAAALKTFDCDQLIHGHTHLPAHHQESFGAQKWQRWVLSDWDLDRHESARPRANALLVNAEGVRSVDLVKS
ncbi:UDP-2,3-diacylglucosamine diphosphatase [Polynucleobacter necessarius]|uniref:UDP-2,3-diacylglucosamine diphosphatase n=1 Tax=Polynucleobacter necessarius TaxID=576610 RepID=UPI000E09DF2C|nr:UDP-2,3-diacylglucosamine diphosphatase [Polynucleobacter necessarius]